jgi:hypothetical protein
MVINEMLIVKARLQNVHNLCAAVTGGAARVKKKGLGKR